VRVKLPSHCRSQEPAEHAVHGKSPAWIITANVYFPDQAIAFHYHQDVYAKLPRVVVETLHGRWNFHRLGVVRAISMTKRIAIIDPRRAVAMFVVESD
jgi:hypothetical protein